MSDDLKIYSLDYLKEKKYSDDTTEFATRLECASLGVSLITSLEEQNLLQVDEATYTRLKNAIFLAVLGDTELRTAFLEDRAIVIDGQDMYRPGDKVTEYEGQV